MRFVSLKFLEKKKWLLQKGASHLRQIETSFYTQGVPKYKIC